MKKTLFIFIIIGLFAVCIINSSNLLIVKADSLNDNIKEQLDKIDFSGLEEFFNQIANKPADIDFIQYVNQLLNGENTFSFNSIFEYLINIIFNNIFEIMPIIISILSISIFCGIINSFKSSFLADGIADIIFFVCFLCVVLLLSSEIILIYNNSKIIIENMAKLTEIMSPIILTLMSATGGVVSVGIYKTSVAFLTSGVINIILSVILPLIGITILFNVIMNFSSSIKLNKFVDCSASIIKWIMGIIITIFGLFISIQGIASASYDGISIRATKYAISNSIPIIGGFVKDSFDLVVAGSVLIKNAIGVASVFALFYTILSPLLYIIIFSTLLKVVSALIEPITDSRISNFCTSISKSISYLSIAIIMVGVMVFILILMMIISANAFI